LTSFSGDLQSSSYLIMCLNLPPHKATVELKMAVLELGGSCHSPCYDLS